MKAKRKQEKRKGKKTVNLQTTFPEKRGLFQQGEYAGVDALWNGDPSNPQIEEGRLSDFFDYYSDRIFPTECVHNLVCEVGLSFPHLMKTVDW